MPAEVKQAFDDDALVGARDRRYRSAAGCRNRRRPSAAGPARRPDAPRRAYPPVTAVVHCTRHAFVQHRRPGQGG